VTKRRQSPLCSNHHSGYKCHFRTNETEQQSGSNCLAWSIVGWNTLSDSNEFLRTVGRNWNPAGW
jgi:hypothetical protein